LSHSVYSVHSQQTGFGSTLSVPHDSSSFPAIAKTEIIKTKRKIIKNFGSLEFLVGNEC